MVAKALLPGRAWSTLVDALLPSRCLGCDASSSSEFCARCREALVVDDAPPESPVIALFAYGGPLQLAITRAKYGPDPATARALASFFATHAARHPGLAALPSGERFAAVTFVAAHWRRRLRRRFDLPALQASALGAARELPVVDTVRTTAYAPPRASGARGEPLVGRYARTRAVGPGPVLVVDDVVTTGATLAEVVRVLEADGISARGVALARTPKEAR